MKRKAMVLGVAAVCVAAGGGLGGYQMMVQHRAEAGVAEAVQALPAGMRVTYGRVDAGFLGRELRVRDLQLTVDGAAPIRIGELQVLEVDRSHEPPQFLHVRAEGVEQTLDGKLPEQVAALDRLGYQRLRGSYELQYRYDPASRELDLRQLRGDLEEMASVRVSLKLANFDLADADPAAGDKMPEFELKEFSLSYRDASLLRRIISQGAQEQGLTEEAFVDTLTAEIDTQLGALEGAFFQQAGEQLKAFVRAPGSLTVSGRPERAVPVVEIIAGAMIQPADLPELLGLRIQAAP